MKLFNIFRKSEFALVGRDIKWDEINGEVFRINAFDQNGTIIDEGGQVHAKDNFSPYGFLIVEWPIIERRVNLPITHKDDFLLVSNIYDNPEALMTIKEYDFLVSYCPADQMENEYASFLHVLHYILAPTKTLEKYYEKRRSTLLGCNPESFVWRIFLGRRIKNRYKYKSKIRIIPCVSASPSHHS